MIYRFTEVLNDLVNYFLLGDILLLEDWKQANHLSDDLAMEFTTNESGDRIFAEGIVIPMTGIENYPYTILFNLSGDRPELCKERNRLQLRKSGYSLKVDLASVWCKQSCPRSAGLPILRKLRHQVHSCTNFQHDRHSQSGGCLLRFRTARSFLREDGKTYRDIGRQSRYKACNYGRWGHRVRAAPSCR